jgi:hypothetical protein
MGKNNSNKFSPNKVLKYIFRDLYSNYFTNFIFIHINKTGGSSIEKALGLPQQKHLTAFELKKKYSVKNWNEKFKFAFVRNPWDKVVSHYHYRYRRNEQGIKEDNIDFIQWVKLTYRDKNPKYYNVPKMFAPQMDWITDENGEIIIDFIGRFYDDETKKLIEKIFKKDIEKFGYKF